MSGNTIFVLGMAGLLLGYGIAMIMLFRDNAVTRRPTLTEEMQKVAAAMNEVQRAFAEEFRPIVVKTTEAMNRFIEAMKRDP